ncbi:MAG TPA: CoA-transferase [Candidatus Acidoferrum sp.]|nr:CoA-transferase [Candidatus Acidoferrum sp.]
MSAYSQDELLICTIARLLEGLGHVAVGASSPIPGAAALLARARSGGRLRVSLLGSEDHNFFTDGGRELFDCAAQGRIDAFFLGGGQIDGEANVNLVGIGDYPRATVRWPGSFGAAYLYFLVPRVILFREEHSARVLVPKVDFISAPGASADNIYRPGGPHALVTGLCLFEFDRERRRFRLASIHPGHSLDEVRANTGFSFDLPDAVPPTAPPDPESLRLIRDSVGREIAEVYPQFGSRLSAPVSR